MVPGSSPRSITPPPLDPGDQRKSWWKFGGAKKDGSELLKENEEIKMSDTQKIIEEIPLSSREFFYLPIIVIRLLQIFLLKKFQVSLLMFQLTKFFRFIELLFLNQNYRIAISTGLSITASNYG